MYPSVGEVWIFSGTTSKNFKKANKWQISWEDIFCDVPGTFLVPSSKNTALIFLELFPIECCAVLVESPMMSSLSSFA